MKRAILTGGSGFLGRHVLDILVERNTEVYAVEHNKKIIAPGVKIIKGGISAIDKDLIEDLRPDHIFHCARPVMPRFKKWGRMLAALKAARYNKKLIRHLSACSHKPKLIFASGSLMYGNSFAAHDESAPLNPISFARQYYHGERPLLYALENNSYPLIMLRFPWILGDGSWFKWFYIDQISKTGAIPAFHPTDNMMEILSAEDAARIIVDYAEKENAGIFNIPAQSSISQQEFLEIVSDIFDCGIKDYREIFDHQPEMEVIEAFRSNILLKTNTPDHIRNFNYTPLQVVLKEIRDSGKTN